MLAELVSRAVRAVVLPATLLLLTIGIPQAAGGASTTTKIGASAHVQPPTATRPLQTGAAPITLQPVSGIGGTLYAVAASDGLIYLGEGSKLIILDVHNPAQPQYLSSVLLIGVPTSIQVVGGLAYVTLNV